MALVERRGGSDPSEKKLSRIDEGVTRAEARSAGPQAFEAYREWVRTGVQGFDQRPPWPVSAPGPVEVEEKLLYNPRQVVQEVRYEDRRFNEVLYNQYEDFWRSTRLSDFVQQVECCLSAMRSLAVATLLLTTLSRG